MQRYFAKYLTKSLPNSLGVTVPKFSFGYVVGDPYH